MYIEPTVLLFLIVLTIIAIALIFKYKTKTSIQNKDISLYQSKIAKLTKEVQEHKQELEYCNFQKSIQKKARTVKKPFRCF